MLLVLLFFIRFWPPSDYEMASLAGGGGGGGMEVNFGDSELGKGDDYKSEVLDVKQNSSSTPTASQPEEEIIASDNDDENTAVITKNPTPKTHTPKPIIKDIKQPKPEKPKVKQSTNDALSSILSGNNRGGDGNDNVGGNKGSSNGNINSGGYYGTGGSGGGTGGGHGSGNGTGSGAGSGSGSGGGFPRHDEVDGEPGHVRATGLFQPGDRQHRTAVRQEVFVLVNDVVMDPLQVRRHGS